MKYVYWFRIFVSFCVFAFGAGLIFIDTATEWKGVFIVMFCGVWNWMHAREQYNMEKVRQWKSMKH